MIFRFLFFVGWVAIAAIITLLICSLFTGCNYFDPAYNPGSG